MTTLFTRYARLTILAILAVTAAGLGALQTLGRQEDPTLVERYGVITTIFPGATAERVEALVTEPIEDAVMELAEVNEINSISRSGVSVLTLELREDLTETEVDQAWTLVREQVDRARQSFPDGVAAPDVDRQYIGAATLIVEVSWSDGRDDDLGLLTRLARQLEDRLQALPGTEETRMFGAAEEEIRVLADPDRLAALGLTTRDVAGVLAASDARAPAGQVRADELTLGVEVDGALDSLDRIRDVPVVQTADGDVIRVGDVARLEKGEATPPSDIALIEGRRAVLVAGYLQPDLRVDQWTDGAVAAVDAFRASLPRGVDANVIFQQREYVERRLHGLTASLMMSASLVFVICLFMMGWRSAIIVGAALPLTVLMVLFAMRLLEEPLHQMSVTGLVIALGMLIDNAIVMADEYRIMRGRGASPLEAVDRSVRQLFAPLAASTVTTMLAFAPIALMPGSSGEFVGFIGVSVMLAVGASFFLAMTVVPAFAAWFDVKAPDNDRGGVLRRGVSAPWLAPAYKGAVALVARAPILGFVIGFALPAAGFYLASTLPMQFFPPTDRDMFQVELRLSSLSSIEETRREVERATALIESYDGVESVSWVIGRAPPRTYYNILGNQSGDPGFAAGWVRTSSAEVTHAIAVDLQRRARETFPRGRLLALPFEQGPPVPAPIHVRLSGPDLETLDGLGDDIRRLLIESDHVTYVDAGLRRGAPVARVAVDEAAAQRTGLRLTDVAGVVRADLDGASGGSVLEGVEELPVVVTLDDAARGAIDSVRGRLLPAAPGSTELGTPLGALGPVMLEPEIAAITRRNGQRVNDIFAFLDPFELPSQAMADFFERLAASGFEAPPGYDISYGGEQEQRGDAFADLFATAAPLMVLMVAALVLAFNNFSYAGAIVLVGVQSVGLALFGVWLFGQPNGFMAIIGAMGLVGLAINGSIVVLSALRASPEAAAGDPRAVAETTSEATRHILATTLTTIGGFIPLLMTGDPFWMPLASAIAGGVAGSAVLALFFAPAAYALMARRSARRSERRAARLARQAAPAE